MTPTRQQLLNQKNTLSTQFKNCKNKADALEVWQKIQAVLIELAAENERLRREKKEPINYYRLNQKLRGNSINEG